MYLNEYLLEQEEGPVQYQVKWANSLKVNNNLVNWTGIIL